MLKESELIRFLDEKPPVDKVVLFVWWHRNGIETSQKTLGIISRERFARNILPGFLLLEGIYFINYE